MIHKMQNNLMRVATEMGLSNLFNMDIICDDSVTGGSNWVKCLLASGLYLYLGMSVPISSYKDMNTCPNRYTPMFGDTTRHLPARIKTHLFTRHHIYHVTSAPCLYFFSHICHSMASNRLGHRHHMWPCDACGNKMMLCTRGKKKQSRWSPLPFWQQVWDGETTILMWKLNTCPEAFITISTPSSLAANVHCHVFITLVPWSVSDQTWVVWDAVVGRAKILDG